VATLELQELTERHALIPGARATSRIAERDRSILDYLPHPILVENDVELLDLTSAHWRLTIEFGKLIFSAGNSGRSISRRVEDVAYRDLNRLGIFVRKPGGRETTTLEFREIRAAPRVARALGARLSAGSSSPCFSIKITAGNLNASATVPTVSIPFGVVHARPCLPGALRLGLSGLSEEEGTAAADGVLAFGLIWLDWLRSHADRLVIPQLKLFLPPRRSGWRPIALLASTPWPLEWRFSSGARASRPHPPGPEGLWEHRNAAGRTPPG